MAKLGFKPQNPGSCVLYIMKYCLLFCVYCIPATDLQLESQPSHCVRSCPQTSTKSFLPLLPKMSSLPSLMPITLFQTNSVMKVCVIHLLCVGYCFTCCKLHEEEQKTNPTVITNTPKGSYMGKCNRGQFSGGGVWARTKKEVWGAFDKNTHKALNATWPSFGLSGSGVHKHL